MAGTSGQKMEGTVVLIWPRAQSRYWNTYRMTSERTNRTHVAYDDESLQLWFLNDVLWNCKGFEGTECSF